MQEAIRIARNHMEAREEEHQEWEGLPSWKDWRWQLEHTIRDPETVEAILGVRFTDDERRVVTETIRRFPMAVTPYYLSLVDPEKWREDPILRQAFPHGDELKISRCDMTDPLCEDTDSPVPGITHRYPDRVLFHVSNVCAMYCRHCTRKRKVGDVDSVPSRMQIQKGLAYIRSHPEVRDVLLSGGDPLMLPDDTLDWLLGELRAIDHVEIIRIGSRIPVVLPYRITDGLIRVLSRHGVIWLNTHFNHPNEMTDSACRALERLALAGVVLGNQSVLLRGVNDCPRIMKSLVQRLVRNRVRPYYLYQCDLSEGLEHFRTPVGKGIEIMENLRGHTSGFAVPTYVIDAPGGGGKIPVMPNYLVSWSSDKVILRNYEGVITTYRMPEESGNTCDLDCANCRLQLDLDNPREFKAVGISMLLSDHQKDITLTPENLERVRRREVAQ